MNGRPKSSASNRRPSVFGCLSVFLGLSFSPPSVFGQDPSSTAHILEEAQRLVDSAAQSYSQGNYEDALTALRKAEPMAEEAQDPALTRIRFNIARCLEQLGRDEEALKAYRRYDALPDAPHRKEKAFQAIRSLETRVFSVLSVLCTPMGAVLEVDGVTDGPAPCPWQSRRVSPGSYSVKVRAPGYVAQVRTVTVSAGQPRSVRFQLEPQPSLPAAASIETAVDEPSPVSPWPYLAMGSGAALGAAGVAFTFAAIDRRNAAEELPPGGERDDIVDTFNSFRTVSYVLYGVGAALGVTGIVLHFLPQGEDDPEAARLFPGPNGVVITF